MYTPEALIDSWPGSRDRTKTPPWNSASAASDERNQQSPTSPCCTSSAVGAPRNSCQSTAGLTRFGRPTALVSSASSPARPPRTSPLWKESSCGRTHSLTLPPSTTGAKSASTNCRPSCWHRVSTATSSASISAPAWFRSGLSAAARCGVGTARRSGRDGPGARRSVAPSSCGVTHFIRTPPPNTTRRDPAGSRWLPSVLRSAGRASRTTPSSIQRRVELLQTCTRSPTAKVAELFRLAWSRAWPGTLAACGCMSAIWEGGQRWQEVAPLQVRPRGGRPSEVLPRAATGDAPARSAGPCRFGPP
mmetsp:Transcript_51428/g.143558  ORF Transcript_51428/g.143558 Transcript_51428/m.143558 type:complete len:304 (-) Transcript_51428:2-913(-)